MTTPLPNNMKLDLPNAVQGVEESPVVARIGVVVDLVEASSITVRISGSPVLVQASYSFPWYEPVLGDRVYVLRQDSQWFVVGTMSGPINSEALNPSFELGTVGALPTNWTFTVTGSGAGTPTFTKTLTPQPLVGQYTGRVTLAPTGAGVSSATLISASVPAVEASRWTGSWFAQIIDLVGPNSLLTSTLLRFQNAVGTSLGAQSLAAVTNFSSTTNRYVQIRPDSTTTAVIAPVGTAFVRMEIDFLFSVNDSSTLFDVDLDYMVLRNVS